MEKEEERHGLGPYLSILTDYGFKASFGNQQNTLFLRRSLQALIMSDTPIKTVTFLKNDLEGASKESRGARFDVLCEDEQGQVFIIEMQVGEPRYFIHRAKHYGFLVFNKMVKKGRYQYNDLKKIYIVSLLAKNAFDTNLYHQIGTLKNQRCEQIDDQITHVIVELNKFKKPLEEISTDLDKLIYTMQQTASKQFHAAGFMREDWLTEALEALNSANLSADERMHLELDIAYRNTYEQNLIGEGIEKGRKEGRKEGVEKGIEKGRKEGIEKGREEGREEGKSIVKQIAEALRKGQQAETVAANLNMPLEEVLDWKQTLGL